MAAIEKRQKEIADGLLPQNEHIRTLTLQRPARPTAEKSESGSPGNHRAGEQTPLQILDEAKAEAEQERTKIVARRRRKLKPSVNVPVKSCVSKCYPGCCWRREDHRTFRG